MQAPVRLGMLPGPCSIVFLSESCLEVYTIQTNLYGSCATHLIAGNIHCMSTGSLTYFRAYELAYSRVVGLPISGGAYDPGEGGQGGNSALRLLFVR